MRINAAAARAYFQHETQRKGGMIDPADLHDNGIEYWAQGPVCGAFHLAPWPNVWMAHYGVDPVGWGNLVQDAKSILRAFWDEKQPDLIIGWTKESNRAALSFARRLGFSVDGRMDLPDGAIIMQSWRP